MQEMPMSSADSDDQRQPHRACAAALREFAAEQVAFVTELAEDAKALHARASRLRTESLRDRAALTGIGIAMLDLGRGISAAPQLAVVDSHVAPAGERPRRLRVPPLERRRPRAA
jgi:hypothetical protein